MAHRKSSVSFYSPAELLSGQVKVPGLGSPLASWAGSASNFTVTADTFLQQGCGNLHFISVEAHPLRDSDWQIVARLRPDSATAQALAKFPRPASGWHRRPLHGGRVQLSVFHGDVNAALTELEQYQRQPVDAWFLDGFAPSKNPDMWRQTVLVKLATLSDAGTTVATFTAAGQVRRDLAALLAMEKVDQRPFKRTSLLSAGLARKPANRAICPRI